MTRLSLSESQQGLLGRMRNAVLATTSAGGSPHLAPVWYLWDGSHVRISTTRSARKVADVRGDPRVAVCVDDQVAGDYLTLYGTASVVEGPGVAELTMPLLLAYLQPDEASARWARLDADNARVVLLVSPHGAAGRQGVR